MLAANDASLETVMVRPRFIWGRGDTSLLPDLSARSAPASSPGSTAAATSTSTCHVRNVCEGALAAAERGTPGEVYFLTDGDPVEMRDFLTRMMQTAGVQPTDRSVPRWLAGALAVVIAATWSLLRLRGEPPLIPTVVRLIGEECTVVDAKARRELGYRAAVTIEAGLAEMAASPTA